MNAHTKDQGINIGDVVTCINAEASFHRLEKGQKYTVEAAYDGSPIVIAGGAYHSVERFRKVEGGE